MSSPLARAVTLLLASALLATAGCRIWRDYGQGNFFDDSPGDGDAVGLDASRGADTPDGSKGCPQDGATAQLSLSSGSGTGSGTICPGQTRWFRFEAEAGSRVSVQVDYPTEQATLSVGRFRVKPTESDLRSLEPPVWNDSGVGFDDLLTVSGRHFLRLQHPATDESAGPVDFTLRVERSAPEGEVYWLAPDGNDANEGSESAPWKSWSKGLSSVSPGDVLIAKPGTWTDKSSCGSAPSPCLSDTSTPEIDCSKSEIADGTRETPIVVAAERERRTHLHDNGKGRALRINQCSYWTVDGFTVRSHDNSVRAPSNVLQVDSSEHIVVRRILASHSNRQENAGLLQVQSGSDVQILESEMYTFHRHGIQLGDTASDVTIRRCYINSRNWDDLGGGYESQDGDRGDNGVQFWEGEATEITNTIIEDVHIGVNVHSRNEPGANPGDDNSFRGTMIHQARYGILMTSTAEDCSSAQDPLCSMENNRVENSLVADTDLAFYIRGGIDNRIHQSTAIRTSEAFTLATGLADSNGNHPPAEQLAVTRSLAHDASNYAFSVDSMVSNWTVDYVNASRTSNAFDMSPTPSHTYQKPPRLGGCMVHIPESSPLSTVDGGPIGAEIVYRYDDSGLTDRKLWNQRTGRFPCGAVVEGQNDVGGSSCRNAHRRLAVGTNGCPVP